MLPIVTFRDTNGLVPAESLAKATATNGAEATFKAVVKGRVPSTLAAAVDAEVRQRQKLFPRASVADVLRDALSFYLARNNGKAARR
jgi:hypothetical protein